MGREFTVEVMRDLDEIDVNTYYHTKTPPSIEEIRRHHSKKQSRSNRVQMVMTPRGGCPIRHDCHHKK